MKKFFNGKETTYTYIVEIRNLDDSILKTSFYETYEKAAAGIKIFLDANTDLDNLLIILNKLD